MELIYSGFNQHFKRDGRPFFAHIFSKEGALPDGFNVGTICLDASVHSSLKWEIESDLPLILWELDFALDEQVLHDEAYYLALELAVDHFTKTIWPKFEDKTFGVVLYRGAFKTGYLDPLKLLASHLPQTVRPFVLLDTDSIPDATTYFRALDQAAFGYLTPILKGKWPKKYPYAFPALAWDHPQSPIGIFAKTYQQPLLEKRLPVGVLLPESGEFPIPEGDFRMIPEQILTHEWDGIDQLVVNPSNVTDRCRRKLQGFLAAGGKIVSIGCLNDEASLQPLETSQLSCPNASR